MEFEYDRNKSRTNKEKHWSVIITRRSEKIRIISARRSRNDEVKLYESN